MKKVIIWVAVLLVALIPTYIIIFQGIKTAVPDVTLGQADLKPAMVQWMTEDSEGNLEPTSPLRSLQKFLFRHSDKVTISSLEELNLIAMEIQPTMAVVELYDLTETDSDTALVASFSLDELAERAPEIVNPTQATLSVEWIVTDRIRIWASYSFEVQP